MVGENVEIATISHDIGEDQLTDLVWSWSWNKTRNDGLSSAHQERSLVVSIMKVSNVQLARNHKRQNN